MDNVEGAFLPVYPSDGNMFVIDLVETGVEPVDIAEYLLKKKILQEKEHTPVNYLAIDT